ncbi:MAG TPA: UdgX family uracil-DNA binding protein [Chthoniobacterales bacterium]|nr:UdgX family uracil-DNA binding protein [Chthoniobacterales bacterium]
MQQITFAPTFSAWQRAARNALNLEVPPDEISWSEIHRDQPGLDLFDETEAAVHNGRSRHLVPRKFFDLASLTALHSDEQRWALLYRLLWRLTHGEPKLLEIFVDPDVALAEQFHKSVRHDVHKMRAFVRFRKVTVNEEPWYVAWFEPQHHIVEHNAPFFVDRFASMRWSILTPERCAHWDGAELSFTEGVERAVAPTADEIEPLWLTYYSNIFNPARIKIHAMTAEMPKKYWRNLPETSVIPALLEEAPNRVEEMLKKSAHKRIYDDGEFRPAPVPETKDLEKVEAASKRCRACPLYKLGTQTVFGEGPKRAPMMLIGEQPGDQEDLAGKPFVGPAGKIMDRALEEAGIDRRKVYVTNAVKHFKWEPRGKRRIHKKPNSREIAACRPWLEAELQLVRPKVMVCLGATAAQTIFGPAFRVTRDRGKVLNSEFAEKTVATVHPSSLLRQPDEESREREYKGFVADLKVALKAAGEI